MPIIIRHAALDNKIGRPTSWLAPMLFGSPSRKNEDGTNQGEGEPSRGLRNAESRKQMLDVIEMSLTDELAILKGRQ